MERREGLEHHHFWHHLNIESLLVTSSERIGVQRTVIDRLSIHKALERCNLLI